MQRCYLITIINLNTIDGESTSITDTFTYSVTVPESTTDSAEYTLDPPSISQWITHDDTKLALQDKGRQPSANSTQ